jgi:cytolysin-activating lysine-acyltransferase
MNALASIPPRGGSYPASHLKAAWPSVSRAGRAFAATAQPAHQGPTPQTTRKPAMTQDSTLMPADKFTVLGKLAWLWMNSPLHHGWEVDLLSNFALPPIELGQYLLLERDGLPVAYCSWAHLDSRAEAAYMLDASHIALADWNGGDHLWFVDWVAPFGKADSFELKNRLADRFPTSVARAIRVKQGSRTGRVMEFRGRDTDRLAVRQQLAGYYREFLETIQTQPTHQVRMKNKTGQAAQAAETSV